MLPSKEEAVGMLEEAEGMNPGPWAAHSRVAALAPGGLLAERAWMEKRPRRWAYCTISDGASA